MANFIFIGNAEPLNLQQLDWDAYTYRQKNYDVHRATKTVQLVWKGEKISNTYDEYLQTLPLGPGTVYLRHPHHKWWRNFQRNQQCQRDCPVYPQRW